MSIKIVKPGLLTTIQDKGRFGFKKYGIITSGAMDTVALRIANLLVGNPEEYAVIETTIVGPKIHFTEAHLIAVTGADLSPTIDNQPLPLWRPVCVNKGSLLQFGSLKNGCRAYISIAGGLAIPTVMESKSTYLRARIGGWYGRALQKGDTIPCNTPTQQSQALLRNTGTDLNHQPFVGATWTLDPQLYPKYTVNPSIRVVKGPEYELFTLESGHNLWNSRYRVTPQSDRMGYRLQGASLALARKVELLSNAVTFGTVQVPSEGNPIVLMADHQTTGGYPRIAQVVTADFSKLAQLVPESPIQFQETSLHDAQQLYFQQERNIEHIKRALLIKTL